METRERLERIVVGTLLNERQGDGFYKKNKASLKKDVFSDKRNAFIFGILEKMHADGIETTTPYDVVSYCKEKGIKYGNPANFAVYMCEICESYAFLSLKSYVKELVQYYVKEKKNGK